MITPAFSRALILSSEPPLPPEMMALACPMQQPGGAIKDETGLASGPGAASSSALPPI